MKTRAFYEIADTDMKTFQIADTDADMNIENFQIADMDMTRTDLIMTENVFYMSDICRNCFILDTYGCLIYVRVIISCRTYLE